MPTVDKWPAKVIATHGMYGCETGCCGWALVDPDNEYDRLVFDFWHPREATENDAALMISEVRDYFDIPEDVAVELGEWIHC